MRWRLLLAALVAAALVLATARYVADGVRRTASLKGLPLRPRRAAESEPAQEEVPPAGIEPAHAV